MQKVEPLQIFDQIKLLADARRMAILRLLMASPATLTQLAQTLKHSPAWIRHHLKTLESANLVEMVEIRTTQRVTEKFYRAKAGAFLVQELILPKSKKPAVIFSGSHDLALEAAASSLARHVNILNLPVGSLDGLVNLRQGLCQISGAHLLDESGEYNTPYVRRFFPDRDVEIITFANRTQGLMVTAGNPKGIRHISDLAHRGLRFVNRNAGSGTRLWFDTEMKKEGLTPNSIHGYEQVVKTHSEAAALIEGGKADAALGLQAAAHQHGLDFIPLFEERYDLVLPREQERILTPLLDYLQTVDFRRAAQSLTGYTTAHSGEQIPLQERSMKSRLSLLFSLLVLSALVLSACTPAVTAAPPEPSATQVPATEAPTDVPTETPAAPANPTLILATTTSTQDSGLLDVLVPLFEEQTGYTLQTVAVGTGQALKMGEEGNADVLLVHAPSSEKTFMEGGFGKDRALVMHNNFIIVGPAADPAGIKGKPVLEAFKAIAAAGETFASRGDDSGTHKAELTLWTKAELDPKTEKPAWYLESGQGMGATLTIASEKDAYTLTDRATYLANKANLQLEILVEGDNDLLNVYHVITVNPDKWPKVNYEGAVAFLNFVILPATQEVIGQFGVNQFGQPLFYPDADRTDADLGLD